MFHLSFVIFFYRSIELVCTNIHGKALTPHRIDVAYDQSVLFGWSATGRRHTPQVDYLRSLHSDYTHNFSMSNHNYGPY